MPAEARIQHGGNGTATIVIPSCRRSLPRTVIRGSASRATATRPRQFIWAPACAGATSHVGFRGFVMPAEPAPYRDTGAGIQGFSGATPRRLLGTGLRRCDESLTSAWAPSSFGATSHVGSRGFVMPAELARTAIRGPASRGYREQPRGGFWVPACAGATNPPVRRLSRRRAGQSSIGTKRPLAASKPNSAPTGESSRPMMRSSRFSTAPSET